VRITPERSRSCEFLRGHGYKFFHWQPTRPCCRARPPPPPARQLPVLPALYRRPGALRGRTAFVPRPFCCRAQVARKFQAALQSEFASKSSTRAYVNACSARRPSAKPAQSGFESQWGH
jgi:hypothetical protein